MTCNDCRRPSNNAEETIKEQDEKIERLDTSLRLLKVRRRVAQLRVIDQYVSEQTGNLKSIIEFAELDEQGMPIEKPKKTTVEGDVIYVDSWVVKFDDKYVEQADLDRSTSLVLFRRIFSNLQKPEDGFALDTVGARPMPMAVANP